ncbi:DUF1214 domain-containing protein [Agrobacterium sp. SHOUNA12C]|uniref:DUF1214 domain-containing protein n=2 Tax=Rhizobium rhizogenes TaxID=359 RepID=B9JBK4_RHIR8|nr:MULTISPECIES: DUF1214 domain-containing protein [Rhizobium]ACM25910.1 conserved hypothetical protein [Rhizobium rhizogenes K84]MCJ9724450.1 DUF1214 domain-containing protein [Agrobacterium sp. BETTINA12B]MCJ9759949.1 DUF1214 domain-containing protein [Agrobacterium sp. SHOUNA12C]OCJ02868.1 hypothetical protein A6U85_29565 [Agrobacterium sp. 13-626]OCJ25027.1 hypothetical protein A6U88_00635 [Agrobacterium sp. B131/95]OCJ31821.1 hypothetical protein A6U89_05530 [Agrobacterium sp. B133/95]
MFRVPLLVAVSLMLAFGGGILFTLFALDATSGFGAIKLGAWQAFPDMHTSDADPYAKSHRARAGRLLYGTAEGLSFIASDDDSGARLTAACSYRISGQTPPARLWTLFIAGNDGEALEAPPGRPSAINSWVVLRNPDSSFSITVSSNAQAGNWLALPSGGNFRLTWTLLDTPAAGNSGLIDLSMPKLEKIGCGHV